MKLFSSIILFDISEERATRGVFSPRRRHPILPTYSTARAPPCSPSEGKRLKGDKVEIKT